MIIKNELGKGVFFNILSKYSNVVIQIILMIILARLLSPTVFGEITLILTFLVFFNYFGNMGIGAAIIQKDNLSKEEIQEAFLFTIILAFFLMIIYLVASRFLSMYYKSNVFEETKILFSVIVFFNCIDTVPNSILRKNKKFKIMSINEIISNSFSAIIAIILALKGFGLYAIIFQNLSRVVLLALLNILLSEILKKFNPKFNFKFIRKIYRYSIFEFLTNLLNYFSRSSDNILVGKYLGLSILGYYDRAYRLILFPIKNLTQLITPVLHPIMAEYRNDKEKMYNYFLKLSKLMMMISVPISVFSYFNANLIIRIVYGENWFESIKYFRILSISLVPQMIGGIFQAFYLSTDNTRKLFYNNIICNGLLVCGIIIGIYLKSLEIVVYNISIGYIIKFCSDIFILNRLIFNKKIILFIKEMKVAYYIILTISISQLLLKNEMKNIYINFLLNGILMLIFYLITIILTGELKFIKNMRRKDTKNIDE